MKKRGKKKLSQGAKKPHPYEVSSDGTYRRYRTANGNYRYYDAARGRYSGSPGAGVIWINSSGTSSNYSSSASSARGENAVGDASLGTGNLNSAAGDQSPDAASTSGGDGDRSRASASSTVVGAETAKSTDVNGLSASDGPAQKRPRTVEFGKKALPIANATLEESLSAIARGSFMLVASLLGSHWQISDADAAKLAIPLGQTVRQLLPNQLEFIEKIGAPMLAGVILSDLISQRVAQNPVRSAKSAPRPNGVTYAATPQRADNPATTPQRPNGQTADITVPDPRIGPTLMVGRIGIADHRTD